MYMWSEGVLCLIGHMSHAMNIVIDLRG